MSSVTLNNNIRQSCDTGNQMKQETSTSKIDLNVKNNFFNNCSSDENIITVKNNCFSSSNSSPILSSNKEEHTFFYNNCPNSSQSSALSAPNTILITNNYTNDDILGKQSNNNNSSITIVTHNNATTTANTNLADHNHQHNLLSSSKHLQNSTMPTARVVLDRINICINNHFSTETNATIPPTDGSLTTIISSPTVNNNNSSKIPYNNNAIISSSMNIKHIAEPDSTTTGTISPELCETKDPDVMSSDEKSKPQNCEFFIGQDVLVRHKDGRFYLGTIVAMSVLQYRIKFGDNTEYWANRDEMSKLDAETEDTVPMCVVCKKVNNDDVVEVCERCGRGYHIRCNEESSIWKGVRNCRRCTTPMVEKRNKISSSFDQCSISLDQDFINKTQLPYEMDRLTWDSKHRVNEEQIYCYCGKTGRWDNKMLQCCKCQQWFHDNCVKCLNYPLFCGDRFYVFSCSICSEGNEFLRRIEMSWSDIVHLILFNLTTKNNWKKYYHIHKDIFPFALENWTLLQVPSIMRKMSETVIKSNISHTLSHDSSRFQSGKEIKKEAAYWGLRSQIPPPAPMVIVPSHINLSDQYLIKEVHLNLVSWETSFSNLESFRISSIDENAQTSEEHVTSCFEISSSQHDTKNSISSLKKSAMCSFIASDSSEKSLDSTNGFADVPSAINDDSNKDNSNSMSTIITMIPTTERKKHSRKRKASQKYSAQNVELISESSDETTSSRGTALDLIIPPPKNFRGSNNPFRLTTPNIPIEVSNKQSFNKNTICKSFDLSTKLAALRKSGLFKYSSPSDLNQAAGQFRLIRTVKRRLSAKDLIIGPNKEVKRRRMKKNSNGNVEVIGTKLQPILNKNSKVSIRGRSLPSNSSSSSSFPMTTLADIKPVVEQNLPNIFHSRRLRQRQKQGKSSTESSRRSSNSSVGTNCSATSIPGGSSLSALNISQSPHKSNTNNSNSTNDLSDLKSSVNKYFGAINRMVNGEHFCFLIKRSLSNGETQFLVEWES